jgi:hypothetical protein
VRRDPGALSSSVPLVSIIDVMGQLNTMIDMLSSLGSSVQELKQQVGCIKTNLELEKLNVRTTLRTVLPEEDQDQRPLMILLCLCCCIIFMLNLMLS